MSHNHRGSVLLYALLILAVIMTVGLVVASTVRTSARTGSYVLQGVEGYYAAESGAEFALYNARKTTQKLTDMDSSASPEKWFLNNQSAWTLRAEASSPEMTVQRLGVGETVSVDLFDFDNPFPASPYATTLNLAWQGPGGEFLEVAWTGWDQFGVIGPTTRRNLTHSDAGGAAIDLTLVQTNAVGYRAIIKNISLVDTDSVQSLVARADSGAKPLPMPVAITATGRYGQAQQIIRATFPRRAPLQSMFDYVLFSECTLDKGTGNVECP